MTKHQQVIKNIDLSQELMDYMVSHKVRTKPNYSYVVFVENDITLNKMNTKLVDELLQEGRKVVKAQKTTNPKKQWIFTIV